MSSPEMSKRWLEAAKILASHPNEKVLCPECGDGYLLVKDERIVGWNQIDRYLICEKCGKSNVMTMGDR